MGLTNLLLVDEVLALLDVLLKFRNSSLQKILLEGAKSSKTQVLLNSIGLKRKDHISTEDNLTIVF